ncbi:MAG: hypothetical protein FJY97_04970 [candidate division Zixibacteria bacterium]|nr:hypothetical protein [candidate division Zixibacteria bacterium]
MFDCLKKQPPEDTLSVAHLAIHLLDKQLEITDTEGLSLKQLPTERRNFYAHQIETMMEERFVSASAPDPERIQVLLSQVETGI